MKYVVVDSRGYDIPEVVGPFQTIEAAEQCARRHLAYGGSEIAADFDVYSEEAEGVDVVELCPPRDDARGR